MEQFCLNGLAIVGASTTAYFLLNGVSKIYKLLKIYFWKTSPKLSKYGKWSVITGSTDGIGKAIAFQLASRGQNIVLIARNPVKLKTVAEEIESKFAVTVKTIEIDFSDSESIYDVIQTHLEDLDVGVLVNNVGTYSPANNFLEIPDLSKHIQNITRVNIVSVMKMHQVVLPGMVKRKRGLIVNISSTTALKPMFPIYGGSKVFIDYFSQALSYEYEDKGITIQTCLPALVRTNLTADVPPTPHTVEPDHYASSLMCWLGKERRCHGCLTHEVVGWILRNLPMTLFVWIWRRSKTLEKKKKQ